MAELADALDSGSSDSNILWVQVPSSAPKNKASQGSCLVFLYDEDLNPPKKGDPAKPQALWGGGAAAERQALFRAAEQGKSAACCDESPIIRTKNKPSQGDALFFI